MFKYFLNSLKIRQKSTSNSQVTIKTPQSANSAAQMLIQPYSMSSRFGWLNLRAQAAWNYYKEISAIRDAVDLGADNFVTVSYAIYDKQNDEFIREYNPEIMATYLLKLLKKPNSDTTGTEFNKSHYITYQVTGDTFFLTTSNEEDSEPLELYYINSKNITSSEDLDEITTFYEITTGQFRGKFIRKELGDGRVVFVNDSGNWQLWVMKNFNPDSFNRSRGLSKLSSIYYELEEHSGVSQHNNAMLRNGARPSGAVIPDRPEGATGASLTDEQVQSLKNSIQSFYSGYNNAGNVMVLDGIKEFKELSKSNKDMEFLNLLQHVKEQIYTNLRIPLPLINAKTMTLRNFEEAKFMLFDLNIIPFAVCYAEELNEFLMPRLDDPERYRLVVDVDKIPAMEVRKMIKIEMFKDDLTRNERREILKYKPVDGADIFTDQMSVLNLAENAKNEQDFIDSLMDKGFSELEAKQKAHDIYGCH